MKMFAALALVMASTGAMAQSSQDSAPVRSEEFIAKRPIPAPENGNIIIRFGEVTQVYFKRPIKSVRLDDGMTAKVVPVNDHVVAFTGLSPGHSEIIVESDDGSRDVWGIVTVVREPHEVRIYQPSPQGNKSGGNGGIIIVNNTGGNGDVDTKSAPAADYKSVLCNEVSCTQPPPPQK